MAARCPAEDRMVLLDYADVHRLVNAEPGVILLHWRCDCGDDHWTATGSGAQARFQESDSSMKTLFGSSV